MVHVTAFECPFQQDATHLSEAAFLDELAKDGQIVLARPQGAGMGGLRVC